MSCGFTLKTNHVKAINFLTRFLNIRNVRLVCQLPLSSIISPLRGWLMFVVSVCYYYFAPMGLVDLSRFGQDNPNEIFVPTDEPHGYIEARVGRQ